MVLMVEKPNKYQNKPVWECLVCFYTTYIRPEKYKRQWVCVGCGGSRVIHFASKKEFMRWHELKRSEKAGEIRNLRRQVDYTFQINGHQLMGGKGKRPLTYRADAVYEESVKQQGFIKWLWQHVVEDSKGVRTQRYVILRELMRVGACPDFPDGITIKET